MKDVKFAVIFKTTIWNLWVMRPRDPSFFPEPQVIRMHQPYFGKHWAKGSPTIACERRWD